MLQRGRQLTSKNMLAAEGSPPQQNNTLRSTEQQHKRTPHQTLPSQIAKQQHFEHSLQRSSWGAVPAKPRRWYVLSANRITVLWPTTSNDT